MHTIELLAMALMSLSSKVRGCAAPGPRARSGPAAAAGWRFGAVKNPTPLLQSLRTQRGKAGTASSVKTTVQFLLAKKFLSPMTCRR
jgi:hypothetical protein